MSNLSYGAVAVNSQTPMNADYTLHESRFSGTMDLFSALYGFFCYRRHLRVVLWREDLRAAVEDRYFVRTWHDPTWFRQGV